TAFAARPLYASIQSVDGGRLRACPGYPAIRDPAAAVSAELSPGRKLPMADLRAGTALAMSGGGFRATLFHIGSLIRLNELGLLSTLARVSSVSGGSIAAGRLAVAWNRLRFVNGVAANLTEEVVAPLRAF